MRPGQTSGRRCRGRAFTIVEVLATLTLASIVLPPATHGVLLCLATAAHARNHAQAASLAQSKMAELVATEQYHDAQMEGDFGEDLPDYTWTAEVSDWEDERLAQLDVAVRWTRREREHQVVLSTLVYLGQTSE